jgi:hypothetical protein
MPSPHFLASFSFLFLLFLIPIPPLPGLHPPFTEPNARDAAVVAGIALILTLAGVEGVPLLFFQ